MKTKLFLGIDFGTTNASIAYVLKDPRHADATIIPVETVSVDQDDSSASRSVRMPTIVSRQFDDRRVKKALIGWEFFQQLSKPKRKADLLRHGQSFFHSVKSDLGSYRVYPRAFSPDYNEPEKVAAAIISHLLQSAKRALPECDIASARVMLTVPASLSVAAREATLQSAKLAGVDDGHLELIDEPTAALIDLLNHPRTASMLDQEEPRYLAIFDYGGGTLDISLIRARFDQKTMSGLSVQNVAISQYRRLGGDIVDADIMEKVVWPQIEDATGASRDELPMNTRRMLEDTLAPTVARGLKEDMCRKIQKNFGQDTRWEACRFASVAITKELKGRVFKVPGLEKPLPRRYLLAAEAFSEIMEPYLQPPPTQCDPDGCEQGKSLLIPLLEVLDRGGIEARQLDYLVLHGGSCRNPLVQRFLKGEFSGADSLFLRTTITKTPDLDASVARGAALACYWKHGRGHELVQPIIPEEIGIMTLSDKPVPVVKAGENLPFPGEDELYDVPTEFAVPRTGQKEMLVPFYSGAHPRIVGTVKVKLPPKVKSGDPVRIKLCITSDKTLHWWHSICDRRFEEAEAINEPWTPPEDDRFSRELMVHRREMREELRRTGAVPISDEIHEASLLHDGWQLDDLELLLADLPEIHDQSMAARADNLRGLLAAARDRDEEEIECYMRAVQRAPTVAVYRGNLGYRLADLGRSEEAVANMRAALSMDPELSYLYERLGDLCREQGDESSALREYKEAVRAAERAPKGTAKEWSNLARLYHKIGDYEQARDARQRGDAELRNQVFDGDHTLRIAGPDSGFLPMEEVDE